MLDNMRLYDEEKEELPICENCGNEVCLYLGEAINKGDDYYCDEMCFVEYHGGIYVWQKKITNSQ